ncbi:hypothetical protein D3877_09510 [Azospirillum cavernae]|uniref:Uncharacterized protein n=1 Tax=Azospirillum cavernae TaxID=2320860 RepID=A0A418W3X4_9PROT|nr:hypothetical protein [Azospirillum cavernae]RJF84720.1 hypothetical protein D3877_09510 [Azospirillum cavernae]
MIELLNDQHQSDHAFRRWVNALLKESTKAESGWVIEGTGVVFSNYGHGEPDTIEDQVMLGVDASLNNGVVKLVKPDTAKQDKGKLTVIGRDDAGRYVLLREGWLKPNSLSEEVREEFQALSGLTPVPVLAGGKVSKRQWYVVAYIDADSATLVKQTVAFAVGCTQARTKAGGGQNKKPSDDEPYSLGLDEKGLIKKVTTKGVTKEVEALQGYVWEALKKILGPALIKPGKSGYEADAVLLDAKLLIEIKTGVAAHNIYEAVGQLMLYPSLITLPNDLRKIILVPAKPDLRPSMAAALAKAQIEVHRYLVGREGKAPKIAFTEAFIKRCGG